MSVGIKRSGVLEILSVALVVDAQPIGEGDLWRASLDGGPAIRLTTHVEEETHPLFSPDGLTLAFVARYESTSYIYLMPAAGGRPRRVTFEGGGVVPVGWFDNQRLMYVSSNAFAPSGRHLKRLDITTGASETLPLANANAATRASDDLVEYRKNNLPFPRLLRVLG